MPLASAHVFASHIGHTGKTTLCFQMSCYYAKRNPGINVLVMDLAEEGDQTKRLLGGVDTANKQVDALFGGVFKLIQDADSKTTGLTSWLTSPTLDLSVHTVKVADHNKAIPPNLYLISSGAWPRTEKEMSAEERGRICSKIQEALEKSTDTWKLFCDTDGDRRPSTFTLIGYGLCKHAIVPLHLNKADLDRTETMLGVLQEYRASGEIDTQVMLIVWNFVKVLKDEELDHKGNKLPFTPTKASLDILDACNQKICQVRKDLQGLFVHEAASDDEFVFNTTTVLRVLADNMLKPSEELGRPFVEIVDSFSTSGKKSMTFKTPSVEYALEGKVIGHVNDSMLNVIDKFEAMVISGGAGGKGGGKGGSYGGAATGSAAEGEGSA